MQRESYREAVICDLGVTSRCSLPGTQGVSRTRDFHFKAWGEKKIKHGVVSGKVGCVGCPTSCTSLTREIS